MIEGQAGVNWDNWRPLVRAVEELGFAGLYRSDHFTNPNPPDYDSLELWMSLLWLADHTERIEFGPLVTPVSFRHPAMTARMASAVDDLSGGRLTLGLGAGWQEREHANYSYELLAVAPRFKRFEEALFVIARLLQHDDPVTFKGEYYQFNEAVLLPRPKRPGGPPILIGGNGPKRTLPVVAKYAREWNAVYQTPEQFAALSVQLDELLAAQGRNPGEVRRSLMTGLLFAQDDAALKVMLRERKVDTVDEIRARGVVAGTGAQIVDQLGRLAEVGVQRVMLQWFALDDLDGLAAFAAAVL
ncbi:MAG: TIGR03560 family F420-dependent LLM class oxidoreductase [Anaerolineae bacterium]|nr:TIGR03560 family F420-dependent LLM class oxidoreductase [Anaerolineae bacterium]